MTDAPSPNPTDTWRAPTEHPPIGVVVEIKLRDGRIRFAHWHAGHQAWTTTRGPLPMAEVLGWRRPSSLG